MRNRAVSTDFSKRAMPDLFADKDAFALKDVIHESLWAQEADELVQVELNLNKSMVITGCELLPHGSFGGRQDRDA